MRDNASAKTLFTKGTALFQQKDYKEALNTFLECQKLSPNKGTAFYIGSCLKRLNGDDHTAKTVLTNELTSDDIECEKVLKTNNYYFLLQITRDSSLEIVKKAYKELAMKFHPDKNHSSKAEEAFRKIYTAYQTISNAEKREKYDKYGADGEAKKPHHKPQYTSCMNNIHKCCHSTMSPCFNSSSQPVQCDKHYNKEQSLEQVSSFRQLLPLIVLFGLYLFVKLFRTLNIYSLIPLHQEEPLFQFNASSKHFAHRRTSINSVNYYTGDAFAMKYPLESAIKESGIEVAIEREFLLLLKKECQEVRREANEIEYKMILNKKDVKIRNELSQQMKTISYQSCRDYEEYSQVIQ